MKWIPALIQLILELIGLWKAKEREAINDKAEEQHRAVDADLDAELRRRGMLSAEEGAGTDKPDIPPKTDDSL